MGIWSIIRKVKCGLTKRRESDLKIFVSGHRGLVGSAIVRHVEKHNEHTWVGATRDELNLFDAHAVRAFLAREEPDAVVIAAAKVGGIGANSRFPVDFLLDNLKIEIGILEACHEQGVPRVLFLGSSCIYPRDAEVPIKEGALLSGPLEPTNDAYALAKISGLRLVRAYAQQYGHKWISAMPTNIYGPRDNFNLETSHVVPALIRKFHDAKISGSESVTLWGDGTPMREFLHADDLASACIFLLENYFGETHINVGTGVDISIAELAAEIQGVSGFEGSIIWDDTKPNGTHRKVLDTKKINDLGWAPQIGLENGLRHTYDWFCEQSPDDNRM